MSLLLGIDQGTSGTTVVALDNDLNFARSASQNVNSTTGRDQGIEQDPWHILDTVISATSQVLGEMGHPTIDAVGLGHQGETVLAWDRRTLDPQTEAIVWSDNRAANVANRLIESGHGDTIEHLSANPVDPYFCAAKYAWILDTRPDLLKLGDNLALGTLETWLLSQMSLPESTDIGTASRTQLTRLGEDHWDSTLLEIFGIPEQSLAPIGPSLGPGRDLHSDAWVGGLPLFAALVDQPAALVGSGCIRQGASKVTYGTGAFAVVNLGRTRPSEASRLIASVGWGDSAGPVFTHDGGVFAAGSGLNWLGGFGIDVSPQAQQRLVDRGPTSVMVLPALHGLGAPHWNREARAAIFGLQAASTGDDVLQGYLNAICFSVAEILTETDVDLSELVRVDGGLTASPYLMQMQADVLGIPLGIGRNREATAIGTALLAGMAAGLVSEADAHAAVQPDHIVEPANTGAAADQFASWKHGVAKLL